MDNEAQALFAELTDLQQRTVTNVLKGMSQRQAYLTAGGKAVSATSIDSSASEILNNRKVRRYLELIRGAEHDETIMGRDEMRRRLTVLARTDLKDLVEFDEVEVPGTNRKQTVWRLRDEDQIDPLKRAAISELTFTKQGPKIKTHSALAAMKQLADLDGLEAPKRTEVSGVGGKPLVVATLDTTDPVEAARAYAELMKDE